MAAEAVSPTATTPAPTGGTATTPAEGTATTATTPFDEMLLEHFGSGSSSGSDSGSAPKWRKTWLEFNCQKGHHYGKYATYQNGRKTRKIPGGGYVGDFGAAIRRGEGRRVAEYVANHDCHYPETLAEEVRRFGLGHAAHQGVAGGKLLGAVSGRGRESDLPDGGSD